MANQRHYKQLPKESLAERRFFITYSSLVIAKPYRFRFLVAKVLQVCITEKINYKKKPAPQSFNKINIP